MPEYNSNMQTMALSTVPSLKPQQCPAFCGRVAIQLAPNNITYSDCQACEWGYRSVDKALCRPCEEPLPLYDWLYLVFIAIIPLLLNSFFVHYYSSKSRSPFEQLLEYLCCVIECVFSIFITLLLMPPSGSLSLYSCTKSNIREWYPLFYNPIVNHTHTLRCNYEIVFPLYSLPFIYLAFCLLWLVILRSILYTILSRRHKNNKTNSSNNESNPNSLSSFSSYYATLYVIPILALIHAVFAGLLYYSFGWVTLLGSLALNAIHLSVEKETRMRQLCVKMLSKTRNLMILFIHMVLFGYSLFTIILYLSTLSLSTRPTTQSQINSHNNNNNNNNYDSTSSYSNAINNNSITFVLLITIIFVPMPSIFYVLTVGLTNPAHVLDAS